MKHSKGILIAFLAITASASYALPMLQVTIQPILVANTDGSMASLDYSYQTYCQKIWAQADIQINFLAANTLNDSVYNSFDFNNAFSMVNAAGHGQNANPLVINAWFVKEVVNGSVYGFAYQDLPFMVMDTSLISGYSALGRVDTFSHELGHNLFLDHYDDTHTVAQSANHLMGSGGIRNIPQSLGDVAPDGLAYDYLSADEIAIARNSKFALPVPEPASLASLAFGAAVLLRKRRKSA